MRVEAAKARNHEKSWGFSFVFFELTSASDLASTFARVADELHHQYALGFTPPALDGTMHVLEVHVNNGAGMTARARKSYLARNERTED